MLKKLEKMWKMDQAEGMSNSTFENWMDKLVEMYTEGIYPDGPYENVTFSEYVNHMYTTYYHE